MKWTKILSSVRVKKKYAITAFVCDRCKPNEKSVKMCLQKINATQQPFLIVTLILDLDRQP